MSFLVIHSHKAYKKLRDFVLRLGQRVEDFGAPYTAFGFFGILNYPVFYLIWKLYNGKSYENFGLRLTATVLCLLLLIRNYWPKRLKIWLPVYWYLTLMFCIPFFFFFMLFKNGGTPVWLMASNTVIFWLIIMVTWSDYLILLFTGIVFAFITYYFTTPNFQFNFSSWWGVWSQFIASFILVGFFAHNKLKFDEKRLKIVATVAESIAHELRTPLRTIYSGAKGLGKYLPQLVEGYSLAKKTQLPVPEIESFHYDVLTRTLDNITSEVESVSTFINMLLINANPSTLNHQLQTCSISSCLQQALARYPFDKGERELINCEHNHDFLFTGNEQLIIHIIFNLLKNALYYIKAANKGRILIWTTVGEHYNQLHFEDTGKGIAKKVLPYIFDRFFSNTYHGTGIGLTFCKAVMENMAGSIHAHSVEGEYAKFILYFPKFWVKLENHDSNLEKVL